MLYYNKLKKSRLKVLILLINLFIYFNYISKIKYFIFY